MIHKNNTKQCNFRNHHKEMTLEYLSKYHDLHGDLHPNLEYTKEQRDEKKTKF